MPPEKTPAALGGDVGGFFATMPSWAKGIVFALTIIPMSVAISGQILGVQVGTLLERYMDIQFEEMRGIQKEAIDRFTAAVGDHDARLTAVEKRLEETNVVVGEHQTWACTHSDTQGLTEDKPAFCK